MVQLYIRNMYCHNLKVYFGGVRATPFFGRARDLAIFVSRLLEVVARLLNSLTTLQNSTRMGKNFKIRDNSPVTKFHF